MVGELSGKILRVAISILAQLVDNKPSFKQKQTIHKNGVGKIEALLVQTPAPPPPYTTPPFPGWNIPSNKCTAHDPKHRSRGTGQAGAQLGLGFRGSLGDHAPRDDALRNQLLHAADVQLRVLGGHVLLVLQHPRHIRHQDQLLRFERGRNLCSVC